ncbi:MAG: hypothetical protein E6084_00805 [Peptoniphilus harei]|uniref:hypothetical protein n=1 Tax=Peptoniphilus genitalis TaxID=3036303 RepID=UPI0024AD553A|nr:hypothetical protein [Peptoniphilus sp. Marseille-Q7072]MDU5466393.1 hypothetical protein [Peptoniphilus harei]
MATKKKKTSTGFAYSINENALNNFELLDLFAGVDENPLLLPKAIEMLLGKDGKEALYNHVRLEDGTVPADKISDELAEIITGNKEVKNS